MLQRGIDTPDMDVTWVSSISWYFLNLFGLNAIFRLILGDDNGQWRERAPCDFTVHADWIIIAAADGTRDMAAMSAMGQGAMGQGMSPMGPQQPDYAKLQGQEKESLDLAGSDKRTKWIGQGIEQRVLTMYRERL